MNIKKISELPDGMAVINIYVEAVPPYMEVVPDVNPHAELEQFEIPECLAYYLHTHWRGTERYETKFRKEFQQEFRKLLGIK